MSVPLLTVEPDPLSALSTLALVRQRPVLVWAGAMMGDLLTPWYAWLRARDRLAALDVVLISGGGDPMLARRLAVLVREQTEQLTILLPDMALSASTLLCLAADELVMTPLSTLGPLDPLLPGSRTRERDNTPAETLPEAAPGHIFTEEVRLFPQMAQAWFGLGASVEEKHAIFAAFERRLFPTSLTAIYRADLEMRAAAEELLSLHLCDEGQRKRISEQLISGFFNHAHAIHRAQASLLGLPVRAATAEEEACLWRLHTWWRARSRTPWNPGKVPEQPSLIRAMLLSQESALLSLSPLDASPQARLELQDVLRNAKALDWREVSPERLTLAPEDLSCEPWS